MSNLTTEGSRIDLPFPSLQKLTKSHKSDPRRMQKLGRNNRSLRFWEVTPRPSRGMSSGLKLMDQSYRSSPSLPSCGRMMRSVSCMSLNTSHPKLSSFYKFKKPNKSAGNDADNEPKPEPGHEFDYKEDWGEALETIVHTVVCVLNVESDEVKVVEVPGKSLAEPFFLGQDSSRIGFIAYDEEPRRLGLIFCPIRRNYVYTYDLTSSELTMVHGSDPVAVRSARLSNDGNRLVFLENSILGPHLKASKLMLLNNLKSGGSKAIEVVGTSITGVPLLDALYIQDSLPSKCWTVDNKHVVFSCMSYNNRKVLAVNVDDRVIIEIKPPTPSGATVLSLVNGVLIVSTSASNMKPSVMVGGLDLSQPDNITWVPAGPSPKSDESIFYSVDTIPSEVDKTPVYAIFCSPTELKSKPGPCVVLPHGGPHSGFVDSYMNIPVLLSKLGFKSLLS